MKSEIDKDRCKWIETRAENMSIYGYKEVDRETLPFRIENRVRYDG